MICVSGIEGNQLLLKAVDHFSDQTFGICEVFEMPDQCAKSLRSNAHLPHTAGWIKRPLKGTHDHEILAMTRQQVPPGATGTGAVLVEAKRRAAIKPVGQFCIIFHLLYVFWRHSKPGINLGLFSFVSLLSGLVAPRIFFQLGDFLCDGFYRWWAPPILTAPIHFSCPPVQAFDF
jgi:hypothetical protein